MKSCSWCTYRLGAGQIGRTGAESDVRSDQIAKLEKEQRQRAWDPEKRVDHLDRVRFGSPDPGQSKRIEIGNFRKIDVPRCCFDWIDLMPAQVGLKQWSRLELVFVTFYFSGTKLRFLRKQKILDKRISGPWLHSGYFLAWICFRKVANCCQTVNFGLKFVILWGSNKFYIKNPAK